MKNMSYYQEQCLKLERKLRKEQEYKRQLLRKISICRKYNKPIKVGQTPEFLNKYLDNMSHLNENVKNYSKMILRNRSKTQKYTSLKTMEVHISPITTNQIASKMTTEPIRKKIKSDLTFHCILCTDSFDNPNLLYAHMQISHSEMYDPATQSQQIQSGPEAMDDECTDTDSEYDFSIMEPICELIHADDDGDDKQHVKHELFDDNSLEIFEINPNGSIQQQLMNNIRKIPIIPPGPGRGRPPASHSDEDIRDPLMGPSLFQCTHCDKSYEIAGDLAKHVRSHTLNKPFQCSICDKTFTHIGSLSTHIRIHSGEKPYKCKTCGKAFTQSSSLMVHMRSHTTRKPFQCHICDKGFVNSSSLVMHMRLHTEGEPFPCSECDKRFKHANMLAEHMRLHSEENLYQCSICREAFKQPSELVQHMKGHTGEKPFQCSLCEKSFTQPGSLNTHMRIHTGEKPFQCKHCDKAFTQASSLSVHLKIHVGEKPFQCNQCDKSYSQQSYLSKHISVFHGDVTDLQCHLCGKGGFHDSLSLILHLTKIHGDIPKLSFTSKQLEILRNF